MIIKKMEHCFALFIAAATFVSAQLVIDPLPYAPIANPLPDTMPHLQRDSVNLKMSKIRLNQAGYRPQDEKLFYYLGSSSSLRLLMQLPGPLQ